MAPDKFRKLGKYMMLTPFSERNGSESGKEKERGVNHFRSKWFLQDAIFTTDALCIQEACQSGEFSSAL